MIELGCDDVETLLQDYVDGTLEVGEERPVRAHLAACGRCRAEERRMRRLLAHVAELPQSIEPPRDLWPEVAARLEERPPVPRAEPARGRVRRGPWRRWSRRQWLAQAAAALVFTVLGAAVGHWNASASAPAPESAALESTALESTALPAASPGFQTVETEYLRAKDALWLVVYSRHDELSPQKLEAVQRNLIVIDKAIWELREALAADPGNERLEGLLLTQHRRGIDLLRRLTDRSA